MIDLDVLAQVLDEAATAELEPDPVRRLLLLGFRAACEAENPRDVPMLIGADRGSRRRVQRAALVRAARLLQPGREEITWETAKRLAECIGYFERNTWHLRRSRQHIADPIARAVRLAFRAGTDFPRSARRLFDELRGQDSPDLSVDEGQDSGHHFTRNSP